MAFMVEGKICCCEALYALSARGTEPQSLAACLGGMDEIGDAEGLISENDKVPVALRLSRWIREVLVKGQAESAQLREVYAKLQEVLLNGTISDGSKSDVGTGIERPSLRIDWTLIVTENLSRVDQVEFEQASQGHLAEAASLSPTNAVAKANAHTLQPSSPSAKSFSAMSASTMYAYV